MARELYQFIDSAGEAGRSTEALLERFQTRASNSQIEMALFREVLRHSFALDKATGTWKWKQETKGGKGRKAGGKRRKKPPLS